MANKRNSNLYDFCEKSCSVGFPFNKKIPFSQSEDDMEISIRIKWRMDMCTYVLHGWADKLYHSIVGIKLRNYTVRTITEAHLKVQEMCVISSNCPIFCYNRETTVLRWNIFSESFMDTNFELNVIFLREESNVLRQKRNGQSIKQTFEYNAISFFLVLTLDQDVTQGKSF